MSWIALGITGASAGVGLLGGLMGNKGGSASKGLDFKIPEWYEDKYYKPTQDLLFKTGRGLLEGSPNKYYAPLGEIGGSEFENMLNMSNRDIRSSVAEMGARTGTRGGAMASATANAIADNTTKYRWQDFLRAMEGRQNFLNVGNNMVSGVRSAGLTYQGQKNQFNLNTAQMENSGMMYNKNLEMMNDEQGSNFFSDVVQGGLTGLSMLGKKKQSDAEQSDGGGSPFFSLFGGLGDASGGDSSLYDNLFGKQHALGTFF